MVKSTQTDDQNDTKYHLEKSNAGDKNDANVDLLKENDQEVFDNYNNPGNNVLNAVDEDEIILNDKDCLSAEDGSTKGSILNEISDAGDDIVPCSRRHISCRSAALTISHNLQWVHTNLS